MQTTIERYKKLRQFILENIKDLSNEQLNKVPAGFTNNIIWNLAHLVAVQQAVCYKRAGKDLKIDESYFDLFKPGTKPELSFDDAMIAKTKIMFIDNIEIGRAHV